MSDGLAEELLNLLAQAPDLKGHRENFELADMMTRAVHSSYELTPTSRWIESTEAIEVSISEALARHLREKHRKFDESFTCPHCRGLIR